MKNTIYFVNLLGFTEYFELLLVIFQVRVLVGEFGESFNPVEDDQMVEFTEPSRKIDAAICDLLAQISKFSDPSFDAEFVKLQEEEIKSIVVRLIEKLRRNLTGKTLAEWH